MKLLLPVIWLALAASAQAAGLEFAETQKAIRPAPEAETVGIEFAFTNTGEKPVTITKADAGCSCMKVVFSGGKLTYGPGESGVLRAIFAVGKFSGTVDRKISVWLDTDPVNPPSQALNVQIHLPVMVGVEPRTLKWETGGAAQAQTIQIRMAEGKPIHVTGIKPSTEQFTCELKVMEDGRSYDLIVTPQDTATPGLTVIRIETDCENPRHQTQQAYAMMHQPMAANGPTK